ncbi:MAG: hypothetical protein WAW61_13045 [Methylococcaceae bacterium]
MSNVEKLPRQTPNPANDLLLSAIRDIDNHMGENYSKLHPELVASYMNAASADNAALLKRFDELNEILMKIFRRFDDYADRD